MAGANEAQLEKLTAMQGLMQISESLAEQKYLLRSIEACLKEMLAVWRAAGESANDAPTPAATPNPATPAATPAAPAPESKTDKLMHALITNQLGLDPKILDGMSEEDGMAMLLSRIPKAGAAPATTVTVVPTIGVPQTK